MNLDKLITLGRDLDQHQGDRLDGWLLSEKLDGCRAFWDGENLWSRGGKRIDPPQRIRATLPTGRRLDGELWAGRGNFEEARLAVQFGRWTVRCSFTAFDCPDAAGTWPERMAEAAKLYANCVGFTPFADWQQCNAMLFEIHAAGGEGIVARSATAIGYEQGRTENFLKIKEPLL